MIECSVCILFLGGGGRGKRSHKGQRRQFTQPEDLKAAAEKEERERQWRVCLCRACSCAVGLTFEWSREFYRGAKIKIRKPLLNLNKWQILCQKCLSVGVIY